MELPDIIYNKPEYVETVSSASQTTSQTNNGWTVVVAKGAKEIFTTYFVLWPKNYFCGFTRFRQF